MLHVDTAVTDFVPPALPRCQPRQWIGLSIRTKAQGRAVSSVGLRARVGLLRGWEMGADSENQPESQAVQKEGIRCSWPPRDKRSHRPDEEYDMLTYILPVTPLQNGEQERGRKRPGRGRSGGWRREREPGDRGQGARGPVEGRRGGRLEIEAGWLRRAEEGTLITDKVQARVEGSQKGWGCTPELATCTPGCRDPLAKASHRSNILILSINRNLSLYGRHDKQPKDESKLRIYIGGNWRIKMTDGKHSM